MGMAKWSFTLMQCIVNATRCLKTPLMPRLKCHSSPRKRHAGYHVMFIIQSRVSSSLLIHNSDSASGRTFLAPSKLWHLLFLLPIELPKQPIRHTHDPRHSIVVSTLLCVLNDMSENPPSLVELEDEETRKFFLTTSSCNPDWVGGTRDEVLNLVHRVFASNAIVAI